MNEGVDLLRRYLHELRLDHKFIELLRGSGLNRALAAPRDDLALDAEELAEGWLEDVAGGEVAPGIRTQVVRFVENRMPGLLLRFRGNEGAVRLTMYNLLAAKYGRLVRGGST